MEGFRSLALFVLKLPGAYPHCCLRLAPNPCTFMCIPKYKELHIIPENGCTPAPPQLVKTPKECHKPPNLRFTSNPEPEANSEATSSPLAKLGEFKSFLDVLLWQVYVFYRYSNGFLINWYLLDSYHLPALIWTLNSCSSRVPGRKNECGRKMWQIFIGTWTVIWQWKWKDLNMSRFVGDAIHCRIKRPAFCFVLFFKPQDNRLFVLVV